MSLRGISALHSFGRTLAAFLILGISISPAAWAQVAGGTIYGTITDPSEKMIPQARSEERRVGKEC